jgi:MoxR-like ATPase
MRVHVATPLRAYIVDLIQATRNHCKVALGASPRASLALQRAAQAAAILSGREYAIVDDVKRLATLVLAHRLILQEDTRTHFEEDAAAAVIQQLLNELPEPA